LGGWSLNECQSESKRKLQVARGKRRKQKVHMTIDNKRTYISIKSTLIIFMGNWRKKNDEKKLIVRHLQKYIERKQHHSQDLYISSQSTTTAEG
jgi:hypothetical protein